MMKVVTLTHRLSSILRSLVLDLIRIRIKSRVGLTMQIKINQPKILQTSLNKELLLPRAKMARRPVSPAKVDGVMRFRRLHKCRLSENWEMHCSSGIANSDKFKKHPTAIKLKKTRI